MSTATQAKKPVEFFFIDMNDPGRYKKLKVSQACDFCRRRKSKCDLGVPGSGVCSNCQRAGIHCVFGSQGSKKELLSKEFPATTNAVAIDFSDVVGIFKDDDQSHQYHRHMHYHHHYHHQEQHQQHEQHRLMVPAAYDWVHRIYDMFPLIDIKKTAANGVFFPAAPVPSDPSCPSSLESLESRLFEHYFINIHPLCPVLDHSHGNTVATVNSMPAHQQYAILALTCSLSYPDLTFLSAFYAQKADLGLDVATDLASAQTLLLLYHYHQTILLHYPGDCSSSSTASTAMQQILHDDAADDDDDPYLDRAKNILTQLSQDDYHVVRTEWLLYLHVCWAGYADTAPWKYWCLDQLWRSVVELPTGNLASFRSLTMTAFQHSPWVKEHGEPKKGFFDQHCAVIQNMLILPSERVRGAEQIEAHVRFLVSTMAQRPITQIRHTILRALKMSLHTYLTFYAASLSLEYPITSDWICQRLANVKTLFEQLGALPALCSSVQDLIYYLSQ